MKPVAALHTEIQYHLDNFPYFRSLSIQGRSRFRNRVVQFLKHKTFFGRDGLHVTTEMQVMVAAAAVQLTFGLDSFLLKKYRHIWLYPQSFYYSLSRQWMKGYASKSGRLAFSWEDFRKGYEDGRDNYNLGLHEMAHALHTTVLEGSADPAFEFYFSNWEDRTRTNFEKLRSGGLEFLRKYGGTNEHEFFAVCVEHFFESPEEFEQILPDLYYHLVVVLYQDPLNTQGDYAVRPEKIRQYNQSAEFPIPIKRIRRSYRYKDWHWTLTVTLLGIFIGSFSLAMITPNLIIPDSGTKVLWLVAFLASLGVLHYPKLKRIKAMPSMPLFILYLIFGIGVNVTTVLAVVNNSIIMEKSTTMHKVTGYTFEDQKYIYKLEDNAFREYRVTRSVRSAGRTRSDHPNYLAITIGTGILGVKKHMGTVELYHNE